RLAPLASAMSRGTQSSMRKFCPMDLEKRKPWRPSRALIVLMSQRSIAILLSSFCLPAVYHRGGDSARGEFPVLRRKSGGAAGEGYATIAAAKLLMWECVVWMD